MSEVGGGGFQWIPTSLRSELGRRIAISGSEEMEALRDHVIRCWHRYPSAHRKSLTTRLQERDNHFRAALWELFWFQTCSVLGGQDPVVEWRNVHHEAKSIDFFMPTFGGGMAVEVSCLSDRDLEVLKSFYVSDLLEAVSTGVLAPHHYLSLRIVEWSETLPDINRVVLQIRDWVLDDLWYSDAGSPAKGRLRLALEAGWIFSIDALPTVAHWGSTWVSCVGEGGVVNLDERIRDRLQARLAKASAIAKVPYVIAIAETGGFVGSARWHRVNALYGSDVVRYRPDGTWTRGRGGDGFFLGQKEWNHPEVSAVVFTGEALPDFDVPKIEWWLNGDPAMPLDATLLSQSGDVVAVRDGELQMLSRGSSEWNSTVAE